MEIPKNLRWYYDQVTNNLDQLKALKLKEKQIRKEKVGVEVKCCKCGKSVKLVFTVAEWAAYLSTQKKLIEEKGLVMSNGDVVRMFRYKNMRFLKHIYLECCPACLQEEERIQVDGLMSVENNIKLILGTYEKGKEEYERSPLTSLL